MCPAVPTMMCFILFRLCWMQVPYAIDCFIREASAKGFDLSLSGRGLRRSGRWGFLRFGAEPDTRNHPVPVTLLKDHVIVGNGSGIFEDDASQRARLVRGECKPLDLYLDDWSCV